MFSVVLIYVFCLLGRKSIMVRLFFILSIFLLLCPSFAKKKEKDTLFRSPKNAAIKEKRRQREIQRLQYKEMIENRQKVVDIVNEKSKRRIVNFIKKNGVSVIASGRLFLIIRSSPGMKRKDYRAFIRRLKKLKGVKKVQKDRVLRASESLTEGSGRSSRIVRPKESKSSNIPDPPNSPQTTEEVPVSEQEIQELLPFSPYRSKIKIIRKENDTPSQETTNDSNPSGDVLRENPYEDYYPSSTHKTGGSLPNETPSQQTNPEVRRPSGGFLNPLDNPYYNYYRSRFHETDGNLSNNPSVPSQQTSPESSSFGDFLNPFDDSYYNYYRSGIYNKDEIIPDNSIPCIEKEVIPEVIEESFLGQIEDVMEEMEEENKPPILSDNEFANCKLYPHCEDGSNPNWASMQIGADLADKIVDRHLNRYGSLKSKIAASVAVVDTGFDISNGGVDDKGNPISLETLSTTIQKSYDVAGEAINDVDGHGTAVAGVIAGKGVGVSQNLNLNLYRITEPNAEGSVSMALLSAAIEKACESSDIVNVSWGSLVDELGGSDVRTQRWYKKAEERGCLIVKAAGNSGIKERERDQSYPMETPYISVAATNEFQTEGGFSTKGMIAAPGVGVFTTLSTKHDYSTSVSDRQCNMNNLSMGPINGTSFASPITAAVKGQILSILKARNVVPRYPAKKIALIKSIALASVKWGEMTGSGKGVINALGAVIIAENINSGNMTNNLDALVDIGKKAVRDKCADTHENCREKTSCSDVKPCMEKERFKSFVCIPPSKQTHNDLLAASSGLLENELSSNLIMKTSNIRDDRIVASGQSSNNFLPSYLGRVFSSSSSQTDNEQEEPVNEDRLFVMETEWQKIAFEEDINPLYKAVETLLASGRLGLDEFITKDKFEKMISSNDFDILFDINHPIGDIASHDGDEELMMKFTQAFRLLSPQDQIDLINKIPDISDDMENNASELGLLYVLNHQKISLSRNVRSTLEDKLRSLGNIWLNGDLKTTTNTYSIASASFNNLPVYDMLFKSLQEEARFNPIKKNPMETIIEKMKDTTLSENSMYLYGYVISSKNPLITRDKKRKMSNLIIEKDGVQRKTEIEKLMDNYSTLEQKLETETSLDKRDDLRLEKSKTLDNLQKAYRNNWNTRDIQNKALETLLKYGNKEDMEKAKKYLLQSSHAKLPVAYTYDSLDDNQRNIVKAMIQNPKFLDDFFKKNLKNTSLVFGLSKSDNYIARTEYVEEGIAQENIVQLIKDSSKIGRDNIRSVLRNNQQEFGSYISRMAHEQIQHDNNKSYIGSLLNQYEELDDMGMSSVLKDNLVKVRDDVLRNPEKYSQSFRQKVRKVYGLGEEN